MADLVDGSCASGKREYKPKKKGEEETPGPSSIPIDPILLAESISQGKLYSDINSDSNGDTPKDPYEDKTDMDNESKGGDKSSDKEATSTKPSHKHSKSTALTVKEPRKRWVTMAEGIRDIVGTISNMKENLHAIANLTKSGCTILLDKHTPAIKAI